MLRRADVVSSLSCALDLAEGHPMGHARRVAYIALALAEALKADTGVRRTAFYGALLHDIGVAPAAVAVDPPLDPGDIPALSADPGLPGDGAGYGHIRLPNVEHALHEHVEAGAGIVGRLGFPVEVAQAVRHHHEWWNGQGFPDHLNAQEVPIAARLVAFADLAERYISYETNPLAARYRVLERVSLLAGRVLDPVIVRHFTLVCEDDSFWIELFSPMLSATLSAKAPADPARFGDRGFLEFAETFTEVIDAKGGVNHSHSRRVGVLSERLARAVGMANAKARRVRIAAVLHDLGHVAVPYSVMTKSDILTVEEMELLRDHPRHSHDILALLPGMTDIAEWAEAHHERLDGRGYPYMLEAVDIPVEARIIAIADTYDALTSVRPYRLAMDTESALAVLENAAGTQLDGGLLRTFTTVARSEPNR